MNSNTNSAAGPGNNEIIEALKNKACLKQEVYRITHHVFGLFRKHIHQITDEIHEKIQKIDKDVEVLSRDNGDFETQIKFSGDTLIFSMHTNVFNFENTHAIHSKSYIKEDESRIYCGTIEIYNFLSDSFKYLRINDPGYLIGRIFVNKERHFFVEGRRQLGFLFNDIEALVINEEFIKLIVEKAILHAIEFDLWVPAYEDVQELTVGEKIQQSGTITHRTGKRMGFQIDSKSKD